MIVLRVVDDQLEDNNEQAFEAPTLKKASVLRPIFVPYDLIYGIHLTKWFNLVMEAWDVSRVLHLKDPFTERPPRRSVQP
jgi:hypothetical protein